MPAIRELSHVSPALPPSPGAEPLKAPDPGDGLSPFARLVRGFAGEADRGEATVRSVLDPVRQAAPLGAPALLALQAGIYRYGETMDLAARLVDKASTAVKTVVQGQ
jgi:hypothetical protein